ncbi:MAG: hypothetical protein IKR15_02835 [Bacteroidales bacterium]|nr:hypothetical protein [Bacteroidales bacterium]
MASFGWFGDQEHRVFNYKPRYYDPDKEERKRLFGSVDDSAGKDGEKKGDYTPGTIIQGSFRDGNYARRRGASKAQSIIGLVGLVLVVVILIYIAKFYMML